MDNEYLTNTQHIPCFGSYIKLPLVLYGSVDCLLTLRPSQGYLTHFEKQSRT